MNAAQPISPPAPLDLEFSISLLERFFAPVPNERVSDWVERNIIFNEPEVKGPFDFSGRQYLRQPLDDNNDSSVSEQTLVFGTGCGKTICYMAGMGYKIVHKPQRGLWVMPSEKGATGVRNFNNSRLRPMCEASPAIARMIPTGAKRFGFTGLHIRMGGMVIDFAGANSPGQLASNRCGDIRLDEVDKFKSKLGNEAGAVYIAKTRADGVVGAQIFQASTPTIDSGAIWQSLLASNLCRRFIPCPHCYVAGLKSANPEAPELPASEELRCEMILAAKCKGFFVMTWSEQFCVLPNKFPDGTAIPAGQVRWSKESKNKDGTWNMAEVIRTAHMECPHCQGKITDSDMVWCDANGAWIPTQRDSLANRHCGYHLPAMYQPRRGFESTFGGLAKKFLEARESGAGMRGFVNSVLAEVDSAQEHGQNKIDLSATELAQPDWVAMLTADFHKNHPYIWFVVRKWCAFKLLPPFAITDGKPAFVPLLDFPGNEVPKKNCLALVNNFPPAWNVLAELMRFDSQTGQSPIIDFLISQKICGEKLVKYFKERAGGNTMDFRRALLLDMFNNSGGDAVKFRAPRGGDSELRAAGHLDLSGEALWEELRDVIKEFKVGEGFPAHKKCVAIDAGYQERFQREVLEVCYASGKHLQWYDPMSKNSPPTFHGFWEVGKPASPAKHGYCQPCPADGWQALRGIPTNRPLGDGKMNRELSIRVEDPFYGTAAAGSKVVPVLHVPQGLFWLRKDDLQKKRTKNLHTVSPNVSWFPKLYGADGSRLADSRFKAADYERQMNEQYYNDTKKSVEPRHGRGGSQNKRHPYHLDDCETYQVALATWHEFFQQNETAK